MSIRRVADTFEPRDNDPLTRLGAKSFPEHSASRCRNWGSEFQIVFELLHGMAVVLSSVLLRHTMHSVVVDSNNG